MSRKSINSNLVCNSDFAIVPAFTAATNTTDRWIDGTSSGSQAIWAYGWGLPSGVITATATAQFDTSVQHDGHNSLKLDCNSSGAISVTNYRTLVAQVLVPVIPDTSYTGEAFIKGTTVATNGAFVDFRELTGALATVTTNSTNKLSGTFDWTSATKVFTTASTTRFVSILLRLNVPGQAQTAWFSDVSVRLTTSPSRTVL